MAMGTCAFLERVLDAVNFVFGEYTVGDDGSGDGSGLDGETVPVSIVVTHALRLVLSWLERRCSQDPFGCQRLSSLQQRTLLLLMCLLRGRKRPAGTYTTPGNELALSLGHLLSWSSS